jgi:hypothetical protein
VSSNTSVPGSAVRVRELRPDCSEELVWDGVGLRVGRAGIVVGAEFMLPLVVLGCATFRRGDVFVEVCSWRRPSTVAQVSAADGTLKGWYGDVCPPPRRSAPGELSYVDLDLDLWRDASASFELAGTGGFVLMIGQVTGCSFGTAGDIRSAGIARRTGAGALPSRTAGWAPPPLAASARLGGPVGGRARRARRAIFG